MSEIYDLVSQEVSNKDAVKVGNIQNRFDCELVIVVADTEKNNFSGVLGEILINKVTNLVKRMKNILAPVIYFEGNEPSILHNPAYI
ncbi:MAG: hypothetical protein JWM20_155 [Patescibacteria group bacterium]|nr:hypothetical protein [Patescibacteria group bacterium]